MCDMGDNTTELFTQDGVILKQAPATYMPYLNAIGTLSITELATDKKKFLEWKPNDVTVDSDIQDQEWAVVNTVQKRIRTLSGSLPSDYQARFKFLKIGFNQEIKSFRIFSKNRQLTFYDGKSEIICVFWFQQNCDYFVSTLKNTLKTSPSKRDKHLFIILDASVELQQLDKSFAELNINNDCNSLWGVVKNFKEQPYEATFEAFSKITDFVYRSPEQREIDDQQKEVLNRSITEYENRSSSEYETTHSHEDYEVIAQIPELPRRDEFPRLNPLSVEQWKGHLDPDGKITDIETIKNQVFRGGVTPTLRQELWKFLLDYFPWDSTLPERQQLVILKNDEYFTMKLQWKSMTKTQEDHFSDYRERKSLIEKDVNRTDRTLEFYAGDNNPNLQTLYDILMTYIMYNFDLGYVQGMSDLLAPILQLMRNEVDAFWCFVGFMNKVSSNFDVDQAGMKEQLANLHTLLTFADPQLANYLDTHDSGNMFFCFRWLLVWFKRELSLNDVMQFWEVMWTGYPCENFHLLVCVAVLESEKQNLIGNGYGFTEILKHINELNGHLDMDEMLNTAEGIFYQIKNAEHLTDNVRSILALPLTGSNNSFGSHELSPFDDGADITNGGTNIRRSPDEPACSVDNVRISPDEEIFEKSIHSSYL